MNITRDMDEILPGGIRVGKEEEERWWEREKFGG